ncbi:MAG: DNA polymerase/3'-5' exonuclease PolX [Bacteriovoracaceae bacterium]|nr:DNA polymerase/3'-5' exonuclease PolX [Bacteroidota bacterium]
MEKAKITEILDEVGTLLELKGENPFKSRAFHNAARILAGVTEDLNELVKNGELRSIKGIGESTAKIISDLVTTGSSSDHESLKKYFPAGIFDVMKIQGMGPKKVSLVYKKLKIASIDDLEKAARAGKLEKLEGFGKKTEENILLGIAQVRTHASKFHIHIAEKAAQAILESLSTHKGIIRSEIAGSLRRKKETIGDIDIVVSAKSKDAQSIMKIFTTHPNVERITGEGETKSSVVLNSGINCDLRIVEEKAFPFALNYFTGSKDHNVRIRSLARENGWSLNEYGFSLIEPGKKIKPLPKSIKSEEDIYKAVGLQYVEPELREDLGEIEASATGKLPTLVTWNDIRGTFHCHTNYSDGHNTLTEMAAAAQKLGWEYLGIADHSKVAAYANGLTEDRVKKQHKEIETLNETFKGFKLFKGTEVDILPSGELDFSDKVLASFDYVVASVHSSFKMSEADMTKRIMKALKNKYVTMLGHLTGRLLLERESYPLNQTEIINAASDLGKIIEINAHPMRLDLDWRMVKYARQKGVLIAINPDSHVTSGLTDVKYGVGIARKGWCEKRDILNTKSVKQVDLYLKK